MEYVHYGNTKYDSSKFKAIKNREFPFVKPYGGLWASARNAKYGWKDWCEAEEFRDCDESNSFQFNIAETANVLNIHTIQDLSKTPHVSSEHERLVYIDFEKLVQDGVDAVELHLSDDSKLYWALYGWDCDSILIMNPEIVEPI